MSREIITVNNNMILDHQKIHTDMLIKLKKEDMTIKAMCFQLGFSTSIWKYLYQGNNITIVNLLKMLTWLDQGIEKYIIK
jgi:hypothetical protein